MVEVIKDIIPSDEKFYTSVTFDFLGTIVRKDWDDYSEHIKKIIEIELGDRISYVTYEKQRLEETIQKLGYAEVNQFEENKLPEDLDVVPSPDKTTEESLSYYNNYIDKGTNRESMASGDGSTADLVEKTRRLFIPNIKYRRSNLNYKIKKLFDLVWQYEQELIYLGKIKTDWELVKGEIDMRFGIDEYHELRPVENRPDETGWIDAKEPSIGKSAKG